MESRTATWTAILCGAALAAGCADQAKGPRAAAEAGGIAVSVGALAYGAVADAEYVIEVYSGAPEAGGELVVRLPALRSSAYGDGAGALTYVAPCDASGDGAATVRLTLTSLYDADGGEIDPASYENPTPLARSTTCAPNADTPVRFDITLMRRAEQGFFDVAVAFSDIFCSAKFDCRGEDGEPIALLHDPLTEARSTTMVMAFACRPRRVPPRGSARGPGAAGRSSRW